MYKALTPKQKVQKLMTDIGGGRCMGKSSNGLPPLNRSKWSKKAQEKQDEIQKIYMKLISGGIIGDSNYIGTILNGWIKKLSPKGINPIQFIQIYPT